MLIYKAVEREHLLMFGEKSKLELIFNGRKYDRDNYDIIMML
jgi:tRNA threonylcarbamoyladenosine modification (KEOPS) complex  Pcc1 subunit